MSRILRPKGRESITQEGPTRVYAHGSRDVATEVYYPAIRDSAMLFPLSKKEEREKTETYSGKNRSSPLKDQSR